MLPPNLDLQKLEKKLEKQLPREERAKLLDHLERLEVIAGSGGAPDPEDQALVLRSLSRIYSALNSQLAVICQELGYPVQQDQWPDSAPLEVLAAISPSLKESPWYQGHLREIVARSGHPWYRIIPLPKELQSDSPRGNDRKSTPGRITGQTRSSIPGSRTNTAVPETAADDHPRHGDDPVD